MLPTAEELIEARSEVVQVALELLAERSEPPREDEYKALRMRDVIMLARAAGCYEAARVVWEAFNQRHIVCAKELVNDREVMEVIALLEKEGSYVKDSFTDELQVLIDLAYHAGFHKEVGWVLSIWTNFRPLTAHQTQPSSA